MTKTRAPRARIAADSMTVVTGAALMTLAVGVASFCVSWSGLVAMAAYAGIPASLRPCVPILVDGALLAQTAVLLVQLERQERTRTTYAALGAYTALSVVTNAAHALDVSATTGAGGFRLWIGLALAAAAPVGVLVSTHALASVAISPAPARRPAPTPATAATASMIEEAVTPRASAAVHPASRPAPARTPRSSATDRGTQRAEAVRLAAEGLSQRAIAERTGAPKTTVARWLATSAPEVVPV
ncbi:MAG: helix-turn-helix domain-containing protein [Cellulomonadaceae bacterium]|nr:helix-turn-helix domain-containing protein [Cellulomonadaceae bacterium]